MPKFDSKSFNPQAFGGYYETVPKLRLNALLKSKIFKSNEEIRNTFANQTGSAYAILPMFGRLTGKPVNYDGVTKYGDAKRLNTFERGVVTFGRKDKFAENDFSYDITSGIDFMSQVANQVSDYLDDALEDTLLSIVRGIFAMTSEAGLKFIESHTYDITANTENTVTPVTLNTAIQKASGDKKAKFALVIMHSMIATSLENQKVLKYLTYTDANGIEQQLNLAQWNGKLVLVDDAYTMDDEGNYVSFVFGEGSFDYEDLGARKPYEMDRDADNDEDVLYVRGRKCIAPYGISYLKANQATLSPTDDEFADGANWDIVNDGNGTTIDLKEIAIAKIITKG